ncbi:MAG: ZIP family metal transporter, partial [Candidatus Micrarchaeota archaeon]
PHIHAKIRGRELATSRKKAFLLAGTVTLHNIPEGLAIGAAFAGSAPLGWLVTASLALQDIPEGFMASAPLVCYGMRKWRAIGIGILSGLVEFLAAIIGFAFISSFSAIIPTALAFSAGAMAYIILVELLPDAYRNGLERIAAISFTAGIIIAMCLQYVTF